MDTLLEPKTSRFQTFRKHKTIATLGLFTLLIMMAYSAFATGILPVHVGSNGNIRTIGVEVYTDSAQTIPLTVIDWGMLDPGSTKTVNCYIYNNGNVPVTLNMTIDNWNPANASSYIDLAWNTEGYLLEQNSFVETTFTLTVSLALTPDTGIKAFSFDITISPGGV